MVKKDKYADKKKKALPEQPAEQQAVENVAATSAPTTSAPVSSAPIAAKSVNLQVCKGTVGTKGRPYQVEVNYFPMNLNKLIDEAFHYDLEFKPPGPKKMVAKALTAFMATHYPKIFYGFDGAKNMYTNKLLEIKNEKETMQVDDRKFEVKIQYTNSSVDLTVLKNYKNPVQGDNLSRALQCLEIVNKSRFRGTNANQFGRQFYFPPAASIDLTAGMELFRGLHQSIVLGSKSVYLNADVLSKAVAVEGKVQVLLEQQFRGDLNALKAHLKGLRIHYKAGEMNQFKMFFGFGLPADKHSFDYNGKKTTVEKYFKDKHKVTLRSPQLPTVQLMPKEKNIFIPMELCYVPRGQMTQKTTPDSCKQRMITHTAVSTDKRKATILEFTQTYKKNNDLAGFGVEIGEKFERVMARIIDPPTIKNGNNKTEKVNAFNGTWKGGDFVEKPQRVVKYAVINCDDFTHPTKIMKLKDDINRMSRQKGVPLEDVQGSDNIFRCKVQGGFDELANALNFCRDNGFGLVIVVISDKIPCYDAVKKIAETQVGILTQCLKTKTVERINHSTLENIFLKINAKLGGVNRDVVEKSYNQMTPEVMFVGADVTHPTADQRATTPSVVGVCASYDPAAFKYHSVWRLQKGGIDGIEDFEQIMVEQLKFFESKNNKKLPKKIFYFRDGVAESQLQNFVQSEIDSMQRAFRRVYVQGGAPQLNVIVVNKRHHLRAFPVTPARDNRDFNNIPPGTIIDTDIVSPYHMQFVLASHSPFQGTLKPTKYTVFLNESKVSADDMQTLTYCLCHMYSRCNRSVSYPSCTYNAHLMAARAKCYITGAELKLDDLKSEFNCRQILKEIVHFQPMFFV